MNWLALILAFVGGLAVAFLTLLVVRAMLERGSESGAMTVRAIITAALGVAVFFIARALKLDVVPMIVAAALGAIIGNFIFTFVLAKKQ